MSLIDRVHDTEMLVNSGSEGEPDELNVERLREDASKWISFESLAKVMARNPQRAKNELRAACRHALSDKRWDVLAGSQKRALAEELVDVVFGLGPIEGFLAY